MLMDALDRLTSAGIAARQARNRKGFGRASNLIEVRSAGGNHVFAVEERTRAPYPNEVQALAAARRRLEQEAQPLLVAPFITEGVGARLVEAGWSWADVAGNFDLRGEGIHLRQRVIATPPRPKARILPRGTGGWAIARWLIEHEGPITTTALARMSGVSQPRSSQVLAKLEALGLASKSGRTGWRADRELLLDRFLAEYPGPAGAERAYYSLDEPLVVAAQAANAVRGRRGRPRIAMSADVGPDLVAPWRRPSVVVVYTDGRVDLDRWLELTPAHGRADANVLHRAPGDQSVFGAEALTVEVGGERVPLADPVQMLWDLEDLGGDDRLEAAGELRRWLLARR